MIENSSNVSSILTQEIEMPLDIILFGSIFYSIIFLIGVVGNILVIGVILVDKELRNFTNYLLANLSIADLLLLFTNVPSGIHDLFAKERWYFGRIWCYLVSFIEHTTGFASILSIFFITCDRYYVICRPLVVKSLMNQSRTFKLIVIIWLLSILINIPFITLTNYSLAKFSNNQLEFKCSTRADQTWALYFMVIDSFVFYLLIGGVLIFMYFRIFNSLKVSTKFLRVYSSHRKTQQESLLEPSSSVKIRHTSVNIGDIQCKHVKKRQQLITMLMIVLITFYVCIFPLKIWNLLNLFAYKIDGFYQKIGFKLYWILNIICRIFYYTNSAINPIVYTFLSKKFRLSFKKMFSSGSYNRNRSKSSVFNNSLRSSQKKTFIEFESL